jgi:hypothetical protein
MGATCCLLSGDPTVHTLGLDVQRHLDDEEDLVIPLLLERGEHTFAGGA